MFWFVCPRAPEVPPLETEEGGGGLVSLLIGGNVGNLDVLLILAGS